MYYTMVGSMKMRRIYHFLNQWVMLLGVTLVSIDYEAAVSVSGSNQESIAMHFINVGQGDPFSSTRQDWTYWWIEEQKKLELLS